MTFVERRMLTATARTISLAVAGGGDLCRIAGDQCAQLSEECAESTEQCGGAGIDGVLPCCDPDHRCVVRTDDFFMCRHRLATTPSGWDGRIADCELGFGDAIRAPSPV